MNLFRTRHLTLMVCTGACWLMPGYSMAQEQGSDATPWRVGMGVAGMERAYAGADRKTIVFPNISYENKNVRIAGLSADLKLGNASDLSYAMRMKYSPGDGYKSGDAPILNGMQDRQGSLWVGPVVKWNTDLARLSFEALGDSLGKSKGVQAKLIAEHDFRSHAFLFTPHVAAEFVDRKYVDYYYGVMNSEATPTRSAYTGQSTLNLEAGLRTSFMISSADAVVADASIKKLGSAITQSPLVDKKSTPVFFLGYMHRF